MKQLFKLTAILSLFVMVALVSVSAQESISAGDSVTGTLVADSGGVPYVISLSAGDIVSIALDSDAFDAMIYVNDADGNELGYEDYGGEGNNALMQFIAPADGDFTILARGWLGSSEGDYALTVTGIETAELTYDTTVDAEFNEATFSYFTFNGTAGDVLNIYGNSGDQDMDMELTLYDLAGNALADNSDGAEGVDPALVRVLLPEDGLYIVEITSWFDEPTTGIMALTLETTELLQVDDGAITISLGDMFDYDVVRFTAETNARYRISLVSPDGTPLTANATMNIDDWTEINLHIEGAYQGFMDFIAPHDGYVDVVLEPGFWSDSVTIEVNVESVE